MAVPVICACGRAYSVKESLLGKKVRCKSCREVLLLKRAPRATPHRAESRDVPSKKSTFVPPLTGNRQAKRARAASQRSDSSAEKPRDTTKGRFAAWLSSIVSWRKRIARRLSRSAERAPFGSGITIDAIAQWIKVQAGLGIALWVCFGLWLLRRDGDKIFGPATTGSENAITPLVFYHVFVLGLAYGLANCKKKAVYWLIAVSLYWLIAGSLIAVQVVLRVLAIPAMILGLSGEHVFMIAAVVLLDGVPAVILYIPAIVIALRNWREFD